MRNEVYTHSHAPVVVAAHRRRTAEEGAWFLLPHLNGDMVLLDVGCGPGTITAGLGRRVATTIGVDNAPQVLAGAEAAANVAYAGASAYELPLRDGSVDVVFAHQLLQHLAEPVAALQEWHRVLRPGGIVAVRDADYGTMTHHPHDLLIDRWLDVYHQVARANGGEPDAGRRLLEWLLTAGFEDAQATSSTWTYADRAGREHWADLWAGRIMVEGFASRAVEQGIATLEELEEIGDAFRRWAATPSAWFAFLHGEVIARRRPEGNGH